MSGNRYSSTWSRTGHSGAGLSLPCYLMSPGAADLTPKEHAPSVIASDAQGDFQHALYLLGVPDIQAAYNEAQMSSAAPQLVGWSHPVVYLAGCATGWEPLHNLDSDSVFPVFQEHYRALCLCLLAGIRYETPGHAVAGLYQ
jgi:hypothetical protein